MFSWPFYCLAEPGNLTVFLLCTFLFPSRVLRLISKLYGVDICHRVHTEWHRLFGVHSIMMEKLALSGDGRGLHVHPISLCLPSRTKLQCMLQLRGQIYSPYFFSILMYSLVYANVFVHYVVATPVADLLSCSVSGLGLPDPDPYKNFTDPQHWFLEMSGFRLRELPYCTLWTMTAGASLLYITNTEQLRCSKYDKLYL